VLFDWKSRLDILCGVFAAFNQCGVGFHPFEVFRGDFLAGAETLHLIAGRVRKNKHVTHCKGEEAQLNRRLHVTSGV
jgi:hypothetical protein